PRGSWATTAPHGNPEGSFDISRLAVAAGAVFVARAAVSQPVKLSRYIEKGIRKKGFALIEALTPCPTSYGRRNRLGRPVDHLLWLRDHVVDAGRKASAEEEERQGDAAEPRLVTGIFADCERPEYTARYRDLVESLAGEDPGPPLPEREVVTAWAEREEEHRP
ncbi:MAG: hypothetical protein JXA90_06375, partial [Planctomycetes bacterium]|nr:hypothetical protein [Planctomycetota bacterium]